MKTYKNLYQTLCSLENLQDAYEKASRRKTNSPKIQEFAKHLQLNLIRLRRELLSKTYKPRPLEKFVLRDPKTRLICVSAFRDRVVHHTLVNVLQPIFQPRFIHDSFASQKGKGTLPALKRFDTFIRKVSRNGRVVMGEKNANAIEGFALKADIRRYFDTVDHEVLIEIIHERIKDYDLLWLVRVILNNYNSGSPGKGMPLGNWTSQFFANVYLDKLDQFVKHELIAKYYVRYVDDFVILHCSKSNIQEYEQRIKHFLKTLKIELHPNKCKIIPLGRGITFLGFRVFHHYRLVRQRNLRKIKAKLRGLIKEYQTGITDAQEVLEVLKGWNGYAMQGNTYHLRQELQQNIEKSLVYYTLEHRKNSRVFTEIQ